MSLTLSLCRPVGIETFAKIYPLILSKSPLPDSLSSLPIVPKEMERPSLIVLDVMYAFACAPMAIQMEKGLQPSTKLTFMPLTASSAVRTFFKSGYENQLAKASKDIESGKDPVEASREVSFSLCAEYFKQRLSMSS